MAIQKKIRVLIVDDSPVSRQMLSVGISSDPQMEVAGTAGNTSEARDKILELCPDVVICDVEMPGMTGIEFVRKLLPQHFVPFIMVSAASNAVFEALEAGAVDFVGKPDVHSRKDIEVFLSELKQKIKTASLVKAASPRQALCKGNAVSNIYPKTNKAPIGIAPQNDGRIIAIGASTGGTEAIYGILRVLPPTIPGIVIVQHIPPVFSRMFAQRLDSQTPLQVKEAQTGDYIEPGKVLVAPGDMHLQIKRVGSRYRAECFSAEKVSGHCPSVDVLFDSVAKEAGNRAIGVILTGMGQDGAKGLLSMRRAGARTVGQDEASSVVYGMPKVAFDIGAVEIQTSLENISQTLCDLIG